MTRIVDQTPAVSDVGRALLSQPLKSTSIHDGKGLVKCTGQEVRICRNPLPCLGAGDRT